MPWLLDGCLAPSRMDRQVTIYCVYSFVDTVFINCSLTNDKSEYLHIILVLKLMYQDAHASHPIYIQLNNVMLVLLAINSYRTVTVNLLSKSRMFKES